MGICANYLLIRINYGWSPCNLYLDTFDSNSFLYKKYYIDLLSIIILLTILW